MLRISNVYLLVSMLLGITFAQGADESCQKKEDAIIQTLIQYGKQAEKQFLAEVQDSGQNGRINNSNGHCFDKNGNTFAILKITEKLIRSQKETCIYWLAKQLGLDNVAESYYVENLELNNTKVTGRIERWINLVEPSVFPNLSPDMLEFVNKYKKEDGSLTFGDLEKKAMANQENADEVSWFVQNMSTESIQKYYLLFLATHHGDMNPRNAMIVIGQDGQFHIISIDHESAFPPPGAMIDCPFVLSLPQAYLPFTPSIQELIFSWTEEDSKAIEAQIGNLYFSTSWGINPIKDSWPRIQALQKGLKLYPKISMYDAMILAFPGGTVNSTGSLGGLYTNLLTRKHYFENIDQCFAGIKKQGASTFMHFRDCYDQNLSGIFALTAVIHLYNEEAESRIRNDQADKRSIEHFVHYLINYEKDTKEELKQYIDSLK